MALLLILTLGLALRLGLALTHGNYLGIDGGAYLLSVQQVLGQNPVDQDFTRPPLAPGWLLAPFVEVWGYDIGYKVWSALFSMFPILPAYWFMREFLSKRTSLITTFFLTFSFAHAELFVTGALPLIGFGLILLALRAISKATHPEIESSRYVFQLGALIPLIALVNMTSAGIALIALPLFAVGVLSFLPYTCTINAFQRVLMAPITLLPVMAGAFLGSVLSIAILPWYMDVLPGQGNLVHPGPILVLAPLGNWGWGVLLFGLLGGLWGLFFGRYWQLRALSVVTIAFSLLAPVWSFDESLINITFRGRYFVILLLHPIIAVALVRLWEWLKVTSMPRMVPQIVLSVFGVVFILGYAAQFKTQAHISDHVTPEVAGVLAYLRHADPESPIIVNSFGLAWWTQALNRTKAYSVWTMPPPPKWQGEYQYVKEVLRWEDGNMETGSNSVVPANWVLLDTSFPARNNTQIYEAPTRPWEGITGNPMATLVYEENGVQLWYIDNDGAIY